jgi:S1-C subfamily serine protease
VTGTRPIWLSIRSGAATGETVEAHGDRFVIGRETDCDLTLADPEVSRHHAQLEWSDGQVLLRDLGSHNGTTVDGNVIDLPVLLRGGEELQLGDTRLTVSATRPSPTGSGVAAPEPARSGTSTVRRMLVRQTRRSNVLTVVAIVLALAVGATVATVAGRNKTTSTADVIAAVAPSTVLVITSAGGERQGSGTGWVLGAREGLIVTNNHVVNGGETFEIGLGRERRKAELVGAAPCEDLAVLRVEKTSGLQQMRLGSQRKLRQGDEVIAIGFPVSASSRDELTATTGVVSVVRSTVDGGGEIASLPNVVRTDAAINPGNSGGPLVTRDKVLVGVNTLGSTSLQNTNYAIGVDRVREITAELRQGRSRAWTGAGIVVPDKDADLSQLGLPALDGLLLAGAVPGSPAAKAGFAKNVALLVGVDGTRISATIAGYCKAVGDKRAGDKAIFNVYPQGGAEPVELPVTFG